MRRKSGQRKKDRHYVISSIQCPANKPSGSSHLPRKPADRAVGLWIARFLAGLRIEGNVSIVTPAAVAMGPSRKGDNRKGNVDGRGRDLGQHAGNRIPENMPSKATVSRKDYHAAHRGPQREARVSNASEKATDKYRMMHNRVKKGGRTGEGALKLVVWFSLHSPSSSSVCLCVLCGSFFRLVGILFPASGLTPAPGSAT